MSRQRITVIQVFRAMGVPTDPEHTWAVGQRVERLWLAEVGLRPVTNLHPKTNGGGSHQIADYPRTWIPRIEKIITEVVGDAKRQTGLFCNLGIPPLGEQ